MGNWREEQYGVALSKNRQTMPYVCERMFSIQFHSQSWSFLVFVQVFEPTWATSTASAFVNPGKDAVIKPNLDPLTIAQVQLASNSQKSDNRLVLVEVAKSVDTHMFHKHTSHTFL